MIPIVDNAIRAAMIAHNGKLPPWTVIMPLRPDRVAYRVWRLGDYFVWTDGSGRIWVAPAGFYLDFFSSPRLVWWWQPPMDGSMLDKVSAAHDLQVRCWRLMGLQRGDVQASFRNMAIAMGASIARAVTMEAFTWPYLWFRAEGEGLNGDERYDHPLPCGKSLPEWVGQHYHADGKGYRYDDV